MRRDVHSRAWWRLLTQPGVPVRTLQAVRETSPSRRELRLLCDVAETALDDPAYRFRHPDLDKLAA